MSIVSDANNTKCRPSFEYFTYRCSNQILGCYDTMCYKYFEKVMPGAVSNKPQPKTCVNTALNYP